MAATNPVNTTNGRRAVWAIVALVIGGILIAAASIGISITLDQHARAVGECRSTARDHEFAAIKAELRANTGLITFAIRNPNPSADELQAATRRYNNRVVKAHRRQADARDEYDAC